MCKLLFPDAGIFVYGTVTKDVYKDFCMKKNVLIEVHTDPEYYNNDLLFLIVFLICDLKY